jgi:hypothetical protein
MKKHKTMKTKIQIKSLCGDILFEHEKEDNTIKDTLLAAIKVGANLSGANLSGANLSGVEFYWADLPRAELYGANLSRADLSRADLSRADLSWAKLSGANLSGANLSGADLSRADLSWARLYGANLSGANLSGADLFGVEFYWANLSRTNLSEVNKKRLSTLYSIIPEGEIIVWKKLNNELVAKLLIPAKAKRINAIGSRKCRFEFAKVVAIYDGKKKVKEGIGKYNSNFIYKVGEMVIPDSFDDDPLVECSHGIHAFITRLEAEEC